MILQRLCKRFYGMRFYSLKISRRIHTIKIQMMITCFVIWGVYSLAQTHIRFVKTITPSLPYHFFVVLKRGACLMHVLRKNAYVLFYRDAAKANVMKQVKGIPGSVLRYDDTGNLWVDDFCVGIPRIQASNGEALHPIAAGVIPKGFVFGYAPHVKSYDSRYANFGLIPIATIKGIGVAVL